MIYHFPYIHLFECVFAGIAAFLSLLIAVPLPLPKCFVAFYGLVLHVKVVLFTSLNQRWWLRHSCFLLSFFALDLVFVAAAAAVDDDFPPFIRFARQPSV